MELQHNTINEFWKPSHFHKNITTYIAQNIKDKRYYLYEHETGAALPSDVYIKSTLTRNRNENGFKTKKELKNWYENIFLQLDTNANFNELLSKDNIEGHIKKHGQSPLYKRGIK